MVRLRNLKSLENLIFKKALFSKKGRAPQTFVFSGLKTPVYDNVGKKVVFLRIQFFASHGGVKQII